MFCLKNLLDEKGIYSYIHREMFGRHMSDTYPFLVFTTDLLSDDTKVKYCQTSTKIISLKSEQV